MALTFVPPLVRPVRLLAFDVDGTLVNSRHQLTPATRAALETVSRQGIRIVLATGRRYTFVLPIAEQVPGDVYVLGSNGAVVRRRHEAVLFTQLLSRATARAVIQTLSPWRRQAVLTFPVDGAGEIIMEDLEDARRHFPGWLDQNEEYVRFRNPIEDSLTHDPVQVMYGGTLAHIAEVRRLLHASTCWSQVHATETIYAQRDLAILDILHPDVNKGAALRRLAAHLGVAREEVIAFGDNYNDLPMLEWAGQAVVMGNAVHGLGRPGWYTTLDCDHDGVAAALRHFGLLD